MPDEVNEAVSSLVKALIHSGVAEPLSITVDLQASGQHPYRILVPDETYPLIGLATTAPLSEL